MINMSGWEQNSSNFPVGFINHSAYNFYDLRRDWLPFNLSAPEELT